MKQSLKKFVDAGYKKKSEASQIDNYVLDKDLSTKRNKVYYDPNTGKAIHTIAGTDTLKDWTNNALIPLGLHHHTNRYKNSERIQKQANEKYGKSNVDLVTHSQSGNIAENLANRKLVGGENTTLNPAIIGSHNKNVKVVKSVFDPVSLLTNTNKNDVKIIPKTFNPIAEHSTDILDKAKKNIFGFGLHHENIQSVLFKRPEWTLAKAKKWLKKHNYKTDVDEKPNHYRFRQFEPHLFENYITKPLITKTLNGEKDENIQFIIGVKQLKTKKDNKLMKNRPDDYSEASSSEEEEEHVLKGAGQKSTMNDTLHEQDIIDRMAKLSHDIHVHHHKHGVKPDIVKGFKILGEGIMKCAVEKPSMTGGKINRSKKFNNWFKDIGNKFKPLNKNLSPIKHQMTQSAVDQIAYQTMTPEQQMQSGIDMFGDVMGNFKGSKSGTKENAPVGDTYHEMYKPVIAQPVTQSAYNGYYNNQYDFNAQPSSYARSTQPSQLSGYGLKGKGSIGKMLKETAANATANLINAGSARAVNEMETRNTTGRGFKKGSQEAKEWGRKMREAREAKKK